MSVVVIVVEITVQGSMVATLQRTICLVVCSLIFVHSTCAVVQTVFLLPRSEKYGHRMEALKVLKTLLNKQCTQRCLFFLKLNENSDLHLCFVCLHFG